MKIIVAFICGLLCAATAQARGYYAEDQFVRMIEQSMSQALHKVIAPGATVTTMQGTYEYRGTRINGNHYHVDIDKLD